MIINDLKENDFYKFLMHQFFYYQYPNVHTKYVFQCRDKDVKFTYDMLERIEKEINWLGHLKFNNINILRSTGLFRCEYLNYLENDFQFNPEKEVCYTFNKNTGKLGIEIRGNILKASLYEIYILQIVNTVYFLGDDNEESLKIGNQRLQEKIQQLKETPIKLIEFGTRRAFNPQWQFKVAKELYDNGCIIGSSNVNFCAENPSCSLIGTIAHECYQMAQGIHHPLDSQKQILEEWIQFYQGKASIALTDTLGTKKFIKDFSKELATIYTGLRHDSGNPIEWFHTMKYMYEQLEIDYKEKTFVFSDSLTLNSAYQIKEECNKYEVEPVFGIGTFLTNDLGLKPLSIVVKIVKANNRDVAKISNNISKSICENKNYLSWLKDSCL